MGSSAPPRSLDTRGIVAAVVIIGALALWSSLSEPARPDSFLPWQLNPTGRLRAASYLALYVLSMPAKELANAMLIFLMETVLGFERMDEELEKGKSIRLEILQNVDLCYLAFNTFVEFLGLNHIATFMLDGPVLYSVGEFTITNGLLAFFLVLCLNDIIYYPLHWIAHWKQFYPYVHKQHHRQFVPFRGYADAANQHPMEQIYGFTVFLLCLRAAALTTQLHIGTALFSTLAWAVLNICNHLAFNSNIHLPLPFPAYPRDHQMHHRNPKCNYSTLTTMCDRLFGSFVPFRNVGGSKESEATKQMLASGERPEAIPSSYSIVLSFIGICLCACGAGAMQEHGIKSGELAAFARSALVVIGLAVASMSTETNFPPGGKTDQLRSQWKKNDADDAGNDMARTTQSNRATTLHVKSKASLASLAI